jgi:hypothetical protein
MSLPSPKSRDVNNLKKWIKGTACIARSESIFLDREEDILNLTGSSDSAVTFVEDTMGDVLFWLQRRFQRVRSTL